jgi:hypothetical protein
MYAALVKLKIDPAQAPAAHLRMKFGRKYDLPMDSEVGTGWNLLEARILGLCCSKRKSKLVARHHRSPTGRHQV